MENNNAANPAAPEAPAPSNKRRRALTALASIVVLAGAGWGVYEWLVASHYESTDNAYVQGNVIQITPQISGTVMAIMADDTDLVKAGQPLVQLDPSDARVALDQAEAALAQAVRQVRTLYVNNASLAAQVSLRQADIVRAQSDIARAQDDLKRRQALSGNGAVSKEELNHSETALANATGWEWRSNVVAPLHVLLTFPVRWLPAAVQLTCLNLIAAVCASLALALLARSVALLPHDRTREQRGLERSDYSLLSIGAAWLPPVLAALVCGL